MTPLSGLFRRKRAFVAERKPPNAVDVETGEKYRVLGSIETGITDYSSGGKGACLAVETFERTIKAVPAKRLVRLG